MVRSRISLDLRAEWETLVRKNPTNELAVKGKLEKFRISLPNRCSALTEEGGLSVQAMNDKLTDVITECATVVGGKIARQFTGKLFRETKDLFNKLHRIQASNPTDRIEQAELYQQT